MIEDRADGFFAWNGNVYKSDIVRAAIRPKVRAIGKTLAKHVRKDANGLKVNPEPYMRFLLEEPNPHMTMQQLLERTITQLELNNNAFIFIERDEFDYPIGLYPISTTSAEVLTDKAGLLYYRFTIKNGKTVTFKHNDVIHLGKDYNDNDLFGDSNADALAPLMEIVNTTDQGIVKAIKNSNVIRWLLKFTSTLRPEDIKAETKRFVNDFLSTESESVGAAATDGKMDAKQVEPKDFVPNEKQMATTTTRILSFFNTNEKIVKSEYTEDEWIAYYELAIEPDIYQLSTLFTRKLFSRKERAFGNKIIFEASNLSFASMSTKMNLVQFVDRGIMSPNEVREILNYAPQPDGDTFIRRLDTAPTTEGGENK
ncbi:MULTISPECIES: phage portal protein [Lysinibacillus]|uniref:phage portal protein n=1 Tax=Lysinibacillus TaxID=400634 RepID=UPI00214BDFF9|nr:MULTISPECIES: phage portal protein [Lysinibacillus]UUV23847.1 phage portal protein [Lysinibacillus sp. FN11]UYB46719.1 phage portal protein [Lysinibacillus capsici]